MVLGIILMFGAASLFWMNQQDDVSARDAAASVMAELVDRITENNEANFSEAETLPELQKPLELLTEEDKKMTEIEIDGIPYIGYISIPKLEVELPVISTWSLSRLNIAPCRYYGSLLGEDLVIMAHNFVSHFGKLSLLELGDTLTFTDMDGKTTLYKVVGKDVLAPTAVEEVTSGNYDLTLFTCTYDGQNRITIYCDIEKT